MYAYYLAIYSRAFHQVKFKNTGDGGLAKHDAVCNYQINWKGARIVRGGIKIDRTRIFCFPSSLLHKVIPWNTTQTYSGNHFDDL